MFFSKSKRPFIIAGPCGAETREQTLATCEALAAAGVADCFRAGAWKPRSKPGTFCGAGNEALEWLVEAKRITGLPFGVEVATPEHVEAALEHGADMVWLGARTTVNPFMVQSIADALKGADAAVIIKNPLTPDVELWSGAVERILGAGIPLRSIGLAHRGFHMAGNGPYRNPPMWHIALEMRMRYPDMAMLCDPSHICGSRALIPDVSQKAADLGYDGLIIESHIDPAEALSDAAQQLTPAQLAEMLRGITWRSRTASNPLFADALMRCRAEIDRLDSEIFGLLSHRMNISEQIGSIKKENGVTIIQEKRWSDILDSFLSQAGSLNLSPGFIRAVLDAVHIESINRQNAVMNDRAASEEE